VALKIALLLALVGIICLPVSAMLGVSTTADYVLDGAEICLALAATLLLGYVAVGIVMDTRALES
jgi:hypothetical protein